MTQATLSLARRSQEARTGARFLAAVLRAAALVRLWRERARPRQALAALDTRMLHDIGVTPSEARREAEKPFWR